ncbi:acylphosphatase [Marinobacter pelagius]|uniref:acylphosphatase n=1 Tax=Marinobacter pelagius TaxID=379482 RepID=A0A1I4VUL1_9GAMM|nr:acylphosphatase [Marinobacter pelagius]RBP28597.1 acylphosphatase [Marinobacter pelagius]SFN04699.1 acylphosphatase [Marinobacter pelagius]
MDKKRWKMLISGKVQGVYYRASTEKEANRLGLSGYARNLPDGRVEVIAEGSPEELQQLHQWCQEGPPAAKVTDIEVEEQRANGEFSNFGVRY